MSVQNGDLDTDPATVLDPDGYAERDWARALAEGDAERARAAFVDDLRRGETRTSPETDYVALKRRWFDDEPGYEGGFDLDPDAVVEGRYVGALGVEHAFPDGVDWSYNATTADGVDFSPEWQWQLNRHYQWITLADAHAETGDERYAAAFERELRSWVASCPRPADDGNEHPSAWRTIEAGIRAGWTWPYAFETFRRSDDVSDEALWLWTCSFRDHARHLLEHVMTHNWKTMETNGLAHVGAMFPEVRGADTFLSTAIDRAVAELERQFYPDGLQQELAPNYGFVALGNLSAALEVAEHRADARRRGVGPVPRRSRERLRTAAAGHARLAGPDGRTPPLHDSGQVAVAAPFADLGRGDPPWRGGDDDLLPWAGYGVLRRGERYGLLDAGPFGAGHQHQDTLQVVGAVGDDWVLPDPGGPHYTDSPVTDHLRSAAAHNVALLDGERHAVRPSVPVADEPLPVGLASGEGLSAAAATRSFETATSGALFDHERVLCDVAEVGWVVFDRIDPRDGDEHTAEWLWHLPGGVAVDGDGATGAGSAVRVEAAGPDGWTMRERTGERDPYRGWQAVPETDGYEALSTLAVESDATGGTELLTVLSPAGATLADASFDVDGRAVTAGGVTVRFGDGERGEVKTVRRDDDEAAPLSLDAHAHRADHQ